MEYEFTVGQRVRHRYEGMTGEVVSCLPGNGSLAAYFVLWDNQRGEPTWYTARDLVAA